MKKFSFTPKTKKIALCVGILLVCGAVLAVVLVNANAKVEASDETSSGVSTEDPELTLSSINSDSSSASGTAGTAFDPETESSRSEPLTTSSKSTSQPSKPVVSGDSVNGSQPTNSTLTNQSQKPTYTSKPTVTQKSNSSTSTSSTSTNNNTGADPIFGNSHGTGGEMTKIDGDGDINKQVGIMD